MTDPLRAKAEAIANDLFWIVDDKAVQIIHKHLLEMEEEQVSTHKRRWTCLDCRELSDEMSWKDIHDRGWRKFRVDTLTYTICDKCRSRDERSSNRLNESEFLDDH